MTTMRVNAKNSIDINDHLSQFLFASECISASRGIRCQKHGTYLSNQVFTQLFPKTMTLSVMEINNYKTRFAYFWILQLNSMFEDLLGAHTKLQNGRLTMMWESAS